MFDTHTAAAFQITQFPGEENGSRLSQNEVLEILHDAPLKTACLGVSGEGLVMLDPHAFWRQPLLVLGDEFSGKTALLRWLFWNCTSNFESIRLVLFHAERSEWRDLIDAAGRGSRLTYSGYPYTPQTMYWLLHLNSLVEMRYSGRQPGEPVLLIIDDLEALLQNLDLDSRLSLEFILLHGPQVDVYTIASLDSQDALSRFSWTRYFGARVYGHMSSGLGRRLGVPTGAANTADLALGEQFVVQTQTGWTTFYLPEEPHPFL